MGLFERVFGREKAPAVAKAAKGTVFKMLDGYTPAFRTWNGSIYESDLIRAALDAHGRHAAKLKINTQGKAHTELQNKLKLRPNQFQTWSQFLYQTCTILYARNTVFIVPVRGGKYGETEGIIDIVPDKFELVEYQGEPYIRFYLKDGKRASVELANVGILTRYQYKSTLFGEENEKAMKPVLDLIEMQRQGITEGIKNGASYRFSAQSGNWAKDEDLAKEMERFNANTFGNKRTSGGVILFPNTYANIQQLRQEAYKVDAEQQKLIENNVFNYFGVNEDILQNKAIGDKWLAFYEGATESFAIQSSEVITNMLFSEREQLFENRAFFTSNRLQYMSNADKMNAISQLADRGLATRNELREILNLPPLPEELGDQIPARGEYYDVSNPPEDKTGDKDTGNGGEDNDGQ